MALTGTGRNSSLEIPDSDDHVADFEEAAKSNRPNMALYHLTAVIKDMQERIKVLEDGSTKPVAKKSTTKKATASSKKTSSSSSDSDDE